MMTSEYIILSTETSFADLFKYVCEIFTDMGGDNVLLSKSGHERYGLNIGDGQYYSFQDSRMKIHLVRNEGHADLFDDTWKFYLTLIKKDFKDDDYNLFKFKIEEKLQAIGTTKITAEIN